MPDDAPEQVTQNAPVGVLTTRIARKWSVKMIIFFVFALGLGAWGWYDATIKYPQRGADHASYMLSQYLAEMQRQGQLLRSSVEDPKAEHDALFARRDSLTQAEAYRLQWLISLSRIHALEALTEENRNREPGADTTTIFENPSQTLDELNIEWQNKSLPKALNAYDIPVQYLIMLVGVVGAAWVGLLSLMVISKRYRYEPATRTLTLPGGKSITPADIEEVDKRKWHKYFVTFHLKNGAGSCKLDLLRYEPLEEWVLEMEKHTDGYVPPAEEDAGDKDDDAAPGDAQQAPSA